jgi:hypothetical protein
MLSQGAATTGEWRLQRREGFAGHGCLHQRAQNERLAAPIDAGMAGDAINTARGAGHLREPLPARLGRSATGAHRRGVSRRWLLA